MFGKYLRKRRGLWLRKGRRSMRYMPRKKVRRHGRW